MTSMIEAVGKQKFFTILILALLFGAGIGILFGLAASRSKESYYYKVGTAHQFMPGTLSCQDAGTINCERCNK